MSESIDIILVEDHPLFRMGIKAALTANSDAIRIIGEADTGKSFYSLMVMLNPSLVLLDIRLPDIGGVEIATWLRQRYPQVKILVLSSETNENTIVELVSVGIDGFISKQEPTSELILAIESVMSGIAYFGKDVSKIIHDISIAKGTSPVQFTDRELEIIKLCAEETTGRKIAERLNISCRTVETHKANIFQKLGINSTVELIRYAVQTGIICI